MYRAYAILGGDRLPPVVKHYRSLPSEQTGGENKGDLLGSPVVLLIEETGEGAFLYRYDRTAWSVGDTWHLSAADAEEQAIFEYGDLIGTWQVIPDEAGDAVEFAVRAATHR